MFTILSILVACGGESAETTPATEPVATPPAAEVAPATETPTATEAPAETVAPATEAVTEQPTVVVVAK
jgi:hypothetical protein